MITFVTYIISVTYNKQNFLLTKNCIMNQKLQEAILASIKTVVDNTTCQVSYDVHTSVERVEMFGREKVIKTHVNITISDIPVDTSHKE